MAPVLVLAALLPLLVSVVSIPVRVTRPLEAKLVWLFKRSNEFSMTKGNVSLKPSGCSKDEYNDHPKAFMRLYTHPIIVSRKFFVDSYVCFSCINVSPINDTTSDFMMEIVGLCEDCEPDEIRRFSTLPSSQRTTRFDITFSPCRWIVDLLDFKINIHNSTYIQIFYYNTKYPLIRLRVQLPGVSDWHDAIHSSNGFFYIADAEKILQSKTEEIIGRRLIIYTRDIFINEKTQQIRIENNTWVQSSRVTKGDWNQLQTSPTFLPSLETTGTNTTPPDFDIASSGSPNIAESTDSPGLDYNIAGSTDLLDLDPDIAESTDSHGLDSNIAASTDSPGLDSDTASFTDSPGLDNTASTDSVGLYSNIAESTDSIELDPNIAESTDSGLDSNIAESSDSGLDSNIEESTDSDLGSNIAESSDSGLDSNIAASTDKPELDSFAPTPGAQTEMGIAITEGIPLYDSSAGLPASEEKEVTPNASSTTKTATTSMGVVSTGSILSNSKVTTTEGSITMGKVTQSSVQQKATKTTVLEKSTDPSFEQTSIIYTEATEKLSSVSTTATSEEGSTTAGMVTTALPSSKSPTPFVNASREQLATAESELIGENAESPSPIDEPESNPTTSTGANKLITRPTTPSTSTDDDWFDWSFSVLAEVTSSVSTEGTNMISTEEAKSISTEEINFMSTEGTNYISTVGTNLMSTVGTNLMSTDGTNLISADGTNLMSTEGTDHISTEGTDYISTEGTNYISTEGTTYISTEGTTYISTEGTDYISTEGTTYISTEGTDYISTEGTTYISTEGTDYISTEGTTYISTEGTTYISTEGTTYTSTEGTTYISTEGTDYTSTEGTTYISTEGTDYTSTEGTTYISTEGTDYTSTEGTTYISTEATNSISTSPSWERSSVDSTYSSSWPTWFPFGSLPSPMPGLLVPLIPIGHYPQLFPDIPRNTGSDNVEFKGDGNSTKSEGEDGEEGGQRIPHNGFPIRGLPIQRRLLPKEIVPLGNSTPSYGNPEEDNGGLNDSSPLVKGGQTGLVNDLSDLGPPSVKSGQEKNQVRDETRESKESNEDGDDDTRNGWNSKNDDEGDADEDLHPTIDEIDNEAKDKDDDDVIDEKETERGEMNVTLEVGTQQKLSFASSGSALAPIRVLQICLFVSTTALLVTICG